MSTSGSAAQFNGVNTSSFTPTHGMPAEGGRESEYEPPVSLSSRNMSSADAATAWRVRRSGKPLPYSRKTMGSLYDFNQE